MAIIALQRAAQRLRETIFPRTGAARGTEQVLQEEASAIHGADLSTLTGNELNRALNRLNSAALCLSGGGIRSASFALGVLQALAVHPRSSGKGAGVDKPEDSLLSKFQYLSTVSGGGYIGSWLSAWVARAGYAAVWKKLTDRRDRPENEPQEISWLRIYSNYLTPKLGLGSADTWAALALVLRNLLLNWLVILPVLWAAIILLKGLVVAMAWVGRYSPNSCFVRTGNYDPVIVFGCLGFLSLFLALRFRTRNRPTRGPSTATQGKFVRCDLLLTLLASFFLILTLAPSCVHDALNSVPLFGWYSLLTIGAKIGAAIYLLSWLLAWPNFRNAVDFFGDMLAWCIAGALYGALLALGFYFAHLGFLGSEHLFHQPLEISLIIFGVPWILLAQLLAEMIFVGFTGYERGSDSDREWLGRAAGLFMMAALIWFVVMALVFVGSEWSGQLWDKFKLLIAPAGGVSGVIAALLGKSSATSATDAGKQTKQPSYKKLIADAVFALAAIVFAAFLVIFSAAVIDKALFQESFLKIAAFGTKVSEDGYAPFPAESIPLLWGFLVVAGVGIVASWFVNINRFSLHALYRNRLIRAFLGASHIEQRKPNPFTDFDEFDNIPVWQLWPRKDNGKGPSVRGKDWQPYHVVNITLNVVSTKKLAWQERKAETFVVSPLYSGTACGWSRDAAGAMQYRGAYRKSDEYGDPNGISLGTALAISGAAASPNMGYHSSSTFAFLLTLFNVRLGWWLGNPSDSNPKIYRGSGPRFAIVPLINELTGNTTDESKYIYLSDGGHFENLGLYEMVRRRCRFIVVSDGGCDPGFQFDDLGNAVRKISLDLGVPIYFRGFGNLKTRAEDDRDPCCGEKEENERKAALAALPFHALGFIDYPKADEGGEPGIILYIKAGYHRDRIFNVGVRNYANSNPDFPHQTTGDQFFSESQFESYRALGFEIADDLLNRTITRLANPSNPKLADLIERWREDFAAIPVP